MELRTTGLALSLCALLGCRAPAEPSERAGDRASSAEAGALARTAPTRAPAPADVAWRTSQSADGVYALAWRPLDRADVPRNEEFAVEVELRKDGAPADGVRLSVRGWMPDHRHGLVQSPIVADLGGGRFRVDGVLLHMRGHWQLVFEATDDPAYATFVFDLDLG